MTKFFIFDVNDARTKTPLEIFEEVIRVNPDKIIIDSETECGIEALYGKIFDILAPWLEQNNKIVNVLTPHLDNIVIRSRIIAERGYANTLMYTGEMIKNRPDMPPPDGYYLSNSIAPYFGNLDEKHFDILYTCYNNNPSPHREILVDRLAREDLLNKGIVTFHYPETCHWQYHDGSKLVDEPDYVIHSTPEYNPINFPRNFYKGFFDIVGESDFEYHHITEKTLKSIFMFKPFIVNGSKGFHNEYLFDYLGLKPYTEIFDYSFDMFDSIEGRVEGIINNVNRLSNSTVAERQQLYKDVIHKLVYNKNKIIELIYDKEKIIPKSLQVLMDGNEHTVYGYSYAVLHMRHMGWIKENITWVN